ncbi:MAG: porin family protein [Bacteroidota bacterium]|nr:porin family protein [Bacteroidota bacterium]
MKKYPIILFIVIFCFLSISKAQNIKGGIACGVNATQVDGDKLYGYNKFGLNVGAIAIVPLWHNFNFWLETAYSQKGSHQKVTSVPPLDGSYELNLRYLDIPLLINYTDKNVITAGAGISINRLTSFTEKDNTGFTDNDHKGTFNNYDYDWIANFNIRIYKGLHFNLRYSYSLKKIRTVYYSDKAPDFGEEYNNILTFRLMYLFERKTKGQEK